MSVVYSKGSVPCEGKVASCDYLSLYGWHSYGNPVRGRDTICSGHSSWMHQKSEIRSDSWESSREITLEVFGLAYYKSEHSPTVLKDKHGSLHLGWSGRNQRNSATVIPVIKRHTALNSRLSLMLEVQITINEVATAMSGRQVQRYDPAHPFQMLIVNPDFQPYALLFHWVAKLKDYLLMLEWIFLPHQFSKTITTRAEMITTLIIRGQQRLLLLSGLEPSVLLLPVSVNMWQ